MTNTNHLKPKGQSDEHYTPKSIFSALNVVFDLDVAAPSGGGTLLLFITLTKNQMVYLINGGVMSG